MPSTRSHKIEKKQEKNCDDDETKVVVKAELFLDMNKNIEDISINLKY